MQLGYNSIPTTTKKLNLNLVSTDCKSICGVYHLHIFFVVFWETDPFVYVINPPKHTSPEGFTGTWWWTHTHLTPPTSHRGHKNTDRPFIEPVFGSVWTWWCNMAAAHVTVRADWHLLQSYIWCLKYILISDFWYFLNILLLNLNSTFMNYVWCNFSMYHIPYKQGRYMQLHATVAYIDLLLSNQNFRYFSDFNMIHLWAKF